MKYYLIIFCILLSSCSSHDFRQQKIVTEAYFVSQAMELYHWDNEKYPDVEIIYLSKELSVYLSKNRMQEQLLSRVILYENTKDSYTLHILPFLGGKCFPLKITNDEIFIGGDINCDINPGKIAWNELPKWRR